MDRILRGVSATLSQTVTVDEQGTDPNPDLATVTITRADGTVLVNMSAADNGLNGGFQYSLSPSQTALVDQFRVDWMFTLNSLVQTVTTYAEVVGGYHFSLPQLRMLDPLGDQLTYSTTRLADARTLAETIIEDATGRAFVPRYRFEKIATSGSSFAVTASEVTAVRSLVVATVPTTVDELAALSVVGGIVTLPWWCRDSYVTIGYEHGLPACPPDVARASMLLARQFLVEGPSDPRVISQTSDYGTVSLWTAGVRGATTSIPEVDAVIDRYRIPAFA